MKNTYQDLQHSLYSKHIFTFFSLASVCVPHIPNAFSALKGYPCVTLKFHTWCSPCLGCISTSFLSEWGFIVFQHGVKEYK
jgi:hypothetical protein